MTQTWRKCPEMSHAEWLAWRREGFGGSDAPSIMKEPGAYGTPFQVWEQKVFGKEKKDNANMAFGRKEESFIRDRFNSHLGIKTLSGNFERIDNPWLRASLDGVTEDCKIAVELKKTNKADHKYALAGKLPPKYNVQCQHIMNILELPGMYYVSSPGDGNDDVIVEVVKDASYIRNELFPEERKLWDLVMAKEPPPLIGKDFVDRSKDKAFAKAEQLKLRTKEALEKAKEDDDKARDALIELAQDHSAQGLLLKITKYMSKGAIDYKQAISDYLDNLRSHYPDIAFGDIPLEPYRKDPFVKWVINGM